MTAQIPVTIPFDPNRCTQPTWDCPATRYGPVVFGQPLQYNKPSGAETQPLARAFHCGQSGDVTIQNADGVQQLIPACVAGVWYPYTFALIVTASFAQESLVWLS